MIFDEKLYFPTANHKKTHELIMDVTHNDWKHLSRTENSEKLFEKTFYYNIKSTKKVKDFQKLSNKETLY